MSETDEKLLSSTAASEQESQQQKLKISVNGDPKFSLSVSGLNHRLICHFTQAVSVLGKRQFIESMLLHLDNDSLNYICESTQLVGLEITRTCMTT